jgi:hypothetical protein
MLRLRGPLVSLTLQLPIRSPSPPLICRHTFIAEPGRVQTRERAKAKSRSATQDISSGRRGGLRSHTGPKGRTYDQLYNEARERGLEGRSKMSKAQLERALDR